MCGPIFVVRDVKETEEWQRSTVRIVWERAASTNGHNIQRNGVPDYARSEQLSIPALYWSTSLSRTTEESAFKERFLDRASVTEIRSDIMAYSWTENILFWQNQEANGPLKCTFWKAGTLCRKIFFCKQVITIYN
jgi:hypothetical protein